MKAKEYFLQIQNLNKLIDCKLTEIQMLRCRAESITIALKFDKIQTSGTDDTIADCIAQMMAVEDEIKKAVEKSMNLIKQCSGIIDEIGGDCSLVLYKRYFQNQKWEQIAFEMNLSYQWVCVLHGRALQKAQIIIDGLDKN